MKLVAALGAGLSAATAVGIVTGALSPLPRRARRRIELDLRRLRRRVAPGVIGFLGAWPVVGVAGATAAGVVAIAAVRWGRARRQSRLALEARQAWPDALRHVDAALRSGASVRNAVLDLAHAGPTALRPAFDAFAAQESVLGFAAALDAVRARLADPVADRVVEILIVADERGGTILPDILDRLAESIADDLHAAEEVRTNSLEQRINARIVTMVPWAVLLLLTVRDGPYREFYASSAGRLVIAVAGVISFAGGALVTRLGRRPAEPRVLIGAGR